MKTIFKSIKLLVGKFPSYLVEEIITIITSIIASLLPIYVVNTIVQGFDENLEFKTVAIKVVACFLGITIIEIVQYFLGLYKQRISRLFNAELSKTFYRKLSSIDYDFHENPMFLNDYTRSLEEGVENIYNLVDYVFGVIKRLLQSISILSVIFAIDTKIIWIAIGVAFVYLLICIRMGYLNKKRWEKQRPFMRRSWYTNRIFTLKDSMSDIKISDVDDMLIVDNDNACDGAVKVLDNYLLRSSIWTLIGEILLASIYPLIIGLLAYSLTEVELASFSSLTVAASSLSVLIVALAGGIGNVFDILPDCKVPFDLLKMQGLIEGHDFKEELDHFESIELKNVDFGYTEKKLNLQGIDMEIKKGQKIAIVGANGAGKTTLVKLLLRLYDAKNGEILINGRNYKETTPSKLRKLVGAVFQNVETYAIPISENVLLRKVENEEDRKLVEEALKFSGLYETVEKMEEGIDTDISREFNKRGMVFSGGQSQRLAIARGYAQNYELLILDEPSSALDPLAEAKVYSNMLEMGRDKTIIFVSHRLTSTAHADMIYLFDNGKIIEKGTHDELMKLNGVYHRMFISQASKYLGEDYEK